MLAYGKSIVLPATIEQKIPIKSAALCFGHTTGVKAGSQLKASEIGQKVVSLEASVKALRMP